MSGNSPGMSPSQDIETFIFIAAIPVVIGVALYFFPFPASWVWHYLTYAEVTLLLFVADFLPDNVNQSLGVIMAGLQQNEAGSVGWGTMMKVESVLFPFNSMFYAVPVGLAAFWLWRMAEPHHQRHTTETLIENQTRRWRFSRMWVKYNPIKESGGDVTKGKFRIPESPEDFASSRGLIQHVLGEKTQFLGDKANEVMLNQLGPAFTSLNDLQEHEQWLAAALLLRADRKKSESDTLLGDISYYYADQFSKRDIDKNVAKIIKHYQSHDLVTEINRKHNFTLTWFVGLMDKATICGKITTSMFPWVILCDRTLFFTLNNFGRQSLIIEALAPTVHYQLEKHANHAVAKPSPGIATKLLKRALVKDKILTDDTPPPSTTNTMMPLEAQFNPSMMQNY